MRSFARVLGIVLIGLASTCYSQSYPVRPVRMVVPYPPGGSIDILGRIVANKLAESLGQNVVVENRPGAAGTIGSALVAKAEADGYTILMTASVHVISPYILKNVNYDPIADFSPVTEVAAGPLIAVAGLQVPAKNVAELLAQAKQAPDKYIFATSGYGAAGHLAVELLRRMVGGQTLLVPYNGSAPALTRMMAGDVHIMFDPMLSAYPFVKRGQLKALAVTSRERLAMAPEIPTVVELGIPELEFYSWYGIWGPRGTPVGVVNRLYAEVSQIIKQPEIDRRLKDSGFVPRGTSPEEFTRYISTEKDRYVGIIKDAAIKMQ